MILDRFISTREEQKAGKGELITQSVSLAREALGIVVTGDHASFLGYSSCQSSILGELYHDIENVPLSEGEVHARRGWYPYRVMFANGGQTGHLQVDVNGSVTNTRVLLVLAPNLVSEFAGKPDQCRIHMLVKPSDERLPDRDVVGRIGLSLASRLDSLIGLSGRRLTDNALEVSSRIPRSSRRLGRLVFLLQEEKLEVWGEHN